MNRHFLIGAEGAVLVSVCSGVAGYFAIQGDWMPAALTASCVPLLYYAWHQRRCGASLLNMEVGLLVVLAYLFFFPVAGFGLWLTDYRGMLFPSVVPVPEITVPLVLFGMAGAMSAFVWGYGRACCFGAPRQWPRLEATPSTAQRWSAITYMLLLGTYGGLALLVYANESLQEVTEKFARHSKDLSLSVTEQLGLALWSMSAPTAAWFGAAVERGNRTACRKPSRVLLMVLGLGLVAAAFFLFGSRKQLVAMVLGAAIVRHVSVARIRPRIVLLGLVVSVMLSVIVVTWRTGVSVTQPLWEVVSGNLGHGVLDTASAIVAEPEILRNALATPERLSTPFVALIPRLVWPTKPLMNDTRLDVVVALGYGKRQWYDSGFPSSIAGEAYAIGGWAAVVFACFALGVVCGLCHTWISSSPSTPAAVAYAAFCISCLWYFKDGDVVMSFTGATKTWLYVAVALALAGVRIRRHRAVSRADGATQLELTKPQTP